MLHRFDAMLNGVSFAGLDPAIILTDITEQKPTESIETATRAIHPGERVTFRRRRTLQVRLTFVVREYDPSRRAALMDRIAEWAADDGWLVLSTRPDQRLYVHTDTLPAMGSSLRWTDEIIIALTAYERPYFEARWPVVSVIAEQGSICPLGTVPEAYVEVDVTNMGEGELTTLTATCATTRIKLDGLAVPPGEHVRIAYTDKDVLTITAGGASALANRTADSHDDLIAYTRQSNIITVDADQAVSAEVSARGRWR